MTRDEVKRLVSIAVANFPGHQNKDMAGTAELWRLTLGHLSYEVALAALASVIASEPWWPTVHAILQSADGILNPDRTTAASAWDEVTREIRRVGTEMAVWTESGPVMQHPRFSSPIIERVVVGLGGWQAICGSDDPKTDRAHFLKLYAELQRREQSDNLMPPVVRKAVEMIRLKGMPNGGEKKTGELSA